MLKQLCVVYGRWKLTFFELCASRRDHSNGATESVWELDGVELWPFKDENIINAKTFIWGSWLELTSSWPPARVEEVPNGSKWLTSGTAGRSGRSGMNSKWFKTFGIIRFSVISVAPRHQKSIFSNGHKSTPLALETNVFVNICYFAKLSDLHMLRKNDRFRQYV